jgi:FkbM family methyltransferase
MESSLPLPLEFYSQFNQDTFLEENVFRGFINGIYMDVGAHDGVSINNTLFFEKFRNWTGVNIEPILSVYNILINNRPRSLNINCAICNSEGQAEFLCNKGYTEMLSGLKNCYDQRHYNRLYRENATMNSTTDTILVETKKIETICRDHDIKHIHYLSIDVEGAEFEVIKSINFDTVFIDVIGFENNYPDVGEQIIEYLILKNYRVILKSSDIFMIHNKSMFNV